MNNNDPLVSRMSAPASSVAVESGPHATPSAAGAIHHEQFRDVRRLFILSMYLSSRVDPNHASGFLTRIQELLVSLGDLGPAIDAWRARRHWPHEANPDITLADALPEIRLRMVAERIPSDVYAVTEIAGKILNRLDPRIRAGFHDVVKAIVRRDTRVAKLTARLSDVTWYERAHEMRTEWTHYSSSFIARDQDGEPIFVLCGYRGKSNRKHFEAQAQLSARDIGTAGWQALKAMNEVAAFVIYDGLLPAIDRDATVRRPARDRDGLPIVRNRLFTHETVSLGQVLDEVGLGRD